MNFREENYIEIKLTWATVGLSLLIFSIANLMFAYICYKAVSISLLIEFIISFFIYGFGPLYNGEIKREYFIDGNKTSHNNFMNTWMSWREKEKKAQQLLKDIKYAN